MTNSTKSSTKANGRLSDKVNTNIKKTEGIINMISELKGRLFGFEPKNQESNVTPEVYSFEDATKLQDAQLTHISKLLEEILNNL